eukprot:366440-Chlamydomonas_euryale.AAC.5
MLPSYPLDALLFPCVTGVNQRSAGRNARSRAPSSRLVGGCARDARKGKGGSTAAHGAFRAANDTHDAEKGRGGECIAAWRMRPAPSHVWHVAGLADMRACTTRWAVMCRVPLQGSTVCTASCMHHHLVGARLQVVYRQRVAHSFMHAPP